MLTGTMPFSKAHRLRILLVYVVATLFTEKWMMLGCELLAYFVINESSTGIL